MTKEFESNEEDPVEKATLLVEKMPDDDVFNMVASIASCHDGQDFRPIKEKVYKEISPTSNP